MSKHHTDWLWNMTPEEHVKFEKDLIGENARLMKETQQLRLELKIANRERDIHDNAYSMACGEVLNG